jgi:hypothetical protein
MKEVIDFIYVCTACKAEETFFVRLDRSGPYNEDLAAAEGHPSQHTCGGFLRFDRVMKRSDESDACRCARACKHGNDPRLCNEGCPTRRAYATYPKFDDRISRNAAKAISVAEWLQDVEFFAGLNGVGLHQVEEIENALQSALARLRARHELSKERNWPTDPALQQSAILKYLESIKTGGTS